MLSVVPQVGQKNIGRVVLGYLSVPVELQLKVFAGSRPTLDGGDAQNVATCARSVADVMRLGTVFLEVSGVTSGVFSQELGCMVPGLKKGECKSS
jgi:hypothetical protein